MSYLAEFEIVKSDYSTIVPHYSMPYVIPSAYSVEDIKQIEKTVDTSTVLGKRDHAIILLASRMGMGVMNSCIPRVRRNFQLNYLLLCIRNKTLSADWFRNIITGFGT